MRIWERSSGQENIKEKISRRDCKHWSVSETMCLECDDSKVHYFQVRTIDFSLIATEKHCKIFKHDSHIIWFNILDKSIGKLKSGKRRCRVKAKDN